MRFRPDFRLAGLGRQRRCGLDASTENVPNHRLVNDLLHLFESRLVQKADGLERQLRRLCLRVECNLRHDHVVGHTALSEHLAVLAESANGRRRNAQQHWIVEHTCRGHGHPHTVGARFALCSALVADARPPLVVRAGGALLGLRIWRIRSGRDAVVGVAVGLLTLAVLVVALGVEHLARVLVRFDDDDFDAGCWRLRVFGVRNHCALAVPHDGKGFAFDTDHGEPATSVRRQVGVEFRNVERLDVGGQFVGRLEGDDVGHG